MLRWREHRLGQILHFGLYSQLGGAWKGTSHPGAAEFIKSSANIADADYEALLATFRPSHAAPRQWAKQARNMGAKYVVITTKHHEGFCLWPSRWTDFTVARTPYKSDLLGEYVKACEAEGIDVMLYYSILDWHHPDWRYELKHEEDRAAFTRYWDFATKQLEELVQRYPRIKGFWFDGTWDASVKANGRLTFELEQRLRVLKPGLVIGSRLRADETGARHFDANGDLMGDYEQGWERKLPDKSLANDWECVMTVPENQWGYHARWTGHVKDAPEILEMAVRCVALGGNFVLNLGPKGDGSLRHEELKLVRGIGTWIRKHGDAVYGCGPSGLEKQDWGWYTRRPGSSTVHAVVFNVPLSGRLNVALPRGSQLKAASLDGRKLNVEAGAGGRWFVHLPKSTPSTAFVIHLELGSGEATQAETART